jgi:hypothetical protein
MTLAADLITDLAIYFNDDEFAAEATYTPLVGAAVKFNVIFDDGYSGASPFDIEIETTGPQALAKTSDVTSYAIGTALAIGGVTYYIISKHKDPPSGGAGTTLLILSTEWHA